MGKALASVENGQHVMRDIVHSGIHSVLVNAAELLLKGVELCCSLSNSFGVGLHLCVNRVAFMERLVEFWHSRDRLHRVGNSKRWFGWRVLRLGVRVL